MTATQWKETELWIIPQEWDILSVEEFAEVVWGWTPSTTDMNNFWWTIPWITPRDLSNYSNRYFSRWERNITEQWLKSSWAKLMPKGTVLLTSRAPIGYVVIANNEISSNQWFKSMICNERSNNLFVYYLMKQNKELLESHWSGSTFKEISWWVLKWLKFPIPPLSEQQAIASTLGSLDDKIELLREQNKKIETMGQSIFKEQFGKYEIEDELPTWWRVGKLGEVIKLLWWFSFKSESYSDDWVYKLVTIGNVNDGNFDPICNNNIWVLPDKLPDYCLLKPWDILLSLTWNVGRVCMVNWKNYVLNQRVAKIIPNWWNHIGYCYFMMRQKSIQELMISISRGTAQMNLSPIETQNIEIIVPERQIIMETENVFRELYWKILKNNEEIQSLTEIRENLLPRLMNGKVRVI